MNMENMVFTEKYRPKKVSDMVGEFKFKILEYLKSPESIPHFLFYSKIPGTGKTSLSKAIINELECDALIINSSDDRTLDVIREKVKNFCNTKSSKEGKRRCVFLDEVDGMSGSAKASQDALRNIMETYSRNAFFILTCNNINKVIEPLQSRCQLISFAYPKKDEIFGYLKEICIKEKMQYTDEGINKLIDINYPSIRNCVVSLQDLWIQKVTVTIDTVQPANYMFKIFWDKLKEGDWRYIKTNVMESSIDPRDLNSYLWEMALKEENIKLIQLTCRNEKDISIGADAKIIVVSSLPEMCK